MSFSKKIKIIRKKNNLTQHELAEKVNVSRKTVSGWENDRSMPDDNLLSIISQAFDILIDDLREDCTYTDFLAKIEADNNEANDQSLAYLVGLQLILIFLSYISLAYIVRLPIITILLIINTSFISKVLNKKSKKRLDEAVNSIKRILILGSVNFVIGIVSTNIGLISKQGLDNLISSVTGAYVGTIIHVLVLTIAVDICCRYKAIQSISWKDLVCNLFK